MRTTKIRIYSIFRRLVRHKPSLSSCRLGTHHRFHSFFRLFRPGARRNCRIYQIHNCNHRIRWDRWLDRKASRRFGLSPYKYPKLGHILYKRCFWLHTPLHLHQNRASPRRLHRLGQCHPRHCPQERTHPHPAGLQQRRCRHLSARKRRHNMPKWPENIGIYRVRRQLCG